MIKIKYFTGLLLCSVVLTITSCKEEEKVTPVAVTNLRAESTPGRIVLRWNTPKDGNVDYIMVNYHDGLLKKDIMRTASTYSDSIEIPNTRKKYGKYKFTVVSVSSTGDKSEVQTIEKESVPAAKTVQNDMIDITANNLSTNAQEPTEGPIKNLLDGNTDTFFHTAWSKNIPGPHWLQVNLNQEIKGDYKFYYAPRKNGNNKPTDFDLMGSTDGKTWFLIKNFTEAADKLPTTSKDAYTSPIFHAKKPFSMIRIIVNKTNNGTVFFTMSEFKFWTVSIYDPEAPDEK